MKRGPSGVEGVPEDENFSSAAPRPHRPVPRGAWNADA
eukprot:CAMPEP_0180117324 /NCGR_PEP_ID=MMETSP0986-20121125/859_1 /TAXON_ID=697907 /ORGANISM="non described non described, Strain CCMP2293" /LENGTH=37 /DNA_ID= /DNA_START= /DNA_END= /DNA_ORIENTATION=